MEVDTLVLWAGDPGPLDRFHLTPTQMRRMLRPPSRPKHFGFIELCRPTLAKAAPTGSGWLHEIKHDGFRLMVRRDGARVRLFTRDGFDWTDRYPSITLVARLLPRAQSFVIDGEAAVCDDKGCANFDLLRYGPKENSKAVLFAFDLLELNGTDLRREPIEARKGELAELLPPNDGIFFNEHIEDDGEVVFRRACKLGYEGIVSKRLGSRYRSGRTPDWVKVKNPKAPAVLRLELEEWR
jgi:bifunctional non-homologous end joining protein LigD